LITIGMTLKRATGGVSMRVTHNESGGKYKENANGC